MNFADLVIPEIEGALTAWSTSVFPDARSVTELPSDMAGALPVLQWQRIGGSGGDPTLDPATVDFDCYAVGRPATAAFANQVWAAILYRLPGLVGDGFVITGTSTVQAPAWRPYDNTNLRRYGGTCQIVSHVTST